MNKLIGIGDFVKFKVKYLGVYTYAHVTGFVIKDGSICPLSGLPLGKIKDIILEPKVSPFLSKNDYGEKVEVSRNDIFLVDIYNESKQWDEWNFDTWGVSGRANTGGSLDRSMMFYLGALERKQIPHKNVLNDVHSNASEEQIKGLIRTAAKRKRLWDEYGKNSEVKKYITQILVEAGSVYGTLFPAISGRI